jgi:amidophosphoribosyltransferase
VSRCVFELVYFARPDSTVFGESVDRVRRDLGRELAHEQPAPGAEVVFSVPDSSNAMALGYSEASGIKLEHGLIRNHYVGRTFIAPQQVKRDFGVNLKFNAVRRILDGKRVVVVDDSIVRGTTSRKIVRMIKAAGAKEVHVRISCPPTISPCFYGVDTPRRSELIAATHSLEEIRRYLEADSLSYLSLDGLLAAVNSHRSVYCTACYTGKYPLPFPRNSADQVQLPLTLVTDREPTA